MERKQIYEKIFKSFIYAIIPSFLLIASLYSWTEIEENGKSLVAEAGDMLTIDKWNELVNYVKEKVQTTVNSITNLENELETASGAINDLKTKIENINIESILESSYLGNFIKHNGILSKDTTGTDLVANGQIYKYKSWNDGTYESNCNDYRHPLIEDGEYGIYRLKVNDVEVDTYCLFRKDPLSNQIHGYTQVYRFNMEKSNLVQMVLGKSDYDIFGTLNEADGYMSKKNFSAEALRNIEHEGYLFLYSDSSKKENIDFEAEAKCNKHTVNDIVNGSFSNDKNKHSCEAIQHPNGWGESYFYLAYTTNGSDSNDCTKDNGDSTLWSFHRYKSNSSKYSNFGMVSDSGCSTTQKPLKNYWNKRVANNSAYSTLDTPNSYSNYDGQVTTGTFSIFVR